MNINIFLYSFFHLTFWIITKTEKIYPMVVDLQPLLDTQRNVISDLEHVIKRKKKIYTFLETELERYQLEHKKITEKLKCNNSEMLIEKFLIIKRLLVDFEFLKHTITEETDLKRNEFLKYPTLEDLEEAVAMLSRLQHYYRLNVTQLADGVLNTTYSRGGEIYTEVFLPMTANDCQEISKSMFKSNKESDKNYKLGLQWLLETERLCDKEEYMIDCQKVDLIREIGEGYKGLGKYRGKHKKYLKWTKKLVALKANKCITELELERYTHQLKLHQIPQVQQYKHKKQKVKKKTLIINPLKEIENCLKGLDRKTYRMLCRDELRIAPEISKRLKCWYHIGRHPFTKLAPFRAEQLYIKPNVFLFHNIVSDSDIETLKNLASPILKPTIAVNGPRMMTSMVYHISKGAELNVSQSEVISQRVSDFTGFSTTSSLGVNNYGVGGYYVGHVDGPGIPDRERIMKQFNLTNADEEKIEGLLVFLKKTHKIASVIVYLSDVEQGGATVFPVLGLSQFPVKGAALFWTNLLPSGHMDYSTCHGVCPVLRGSRWVATKFIDSASQVFNRPCTFSITSRRIEDIPHPVLMD